ncbi:hypothetical protein [Geobacillus sp. Y412MC52]|uniref:hypothetical protein n=1 Tax=Geobacillus sp. (strain Y412MC52) TaxID=550542 RepID=UPI00018C1743|nr:hypothetical protein [Geobacillus sp. Y412MC52]ADU93742.1 hypothetical protein GYMC52_1279 [Geobacillus sp. Y412MC52]
MAEPYSLRACMAAHFSVAAFAVHVMRCVQAELIRFDPKAAVHVDRGEGYSHLYGSAQGRVFSILLTSGEADERRAEGPYALDRYIWTELGKKGIFPMQMTPYLQAVWLTES